MEGLKIKIKQKQIDVPRDLSEKVYDGVKGLISSLALFNELGFDLLPLLPYARKFRTFEDVVVLGTGGSCLSGKLFSNLKETSGPRMHFVDNVDSHDWNKLFSKIDQKTTGVIAISKSGSTTEILCQTLMAVKKWTGLPHGDHFVFVTDPEDSALREIAEYHGINCLNHPSEIGGRFSAFSIVGLLPALIAGLDVKSVVTGAQNAVKSFLTCGGEENLAISNAFLQSELFKKGINITVQFCYSNRLIFFSDWYRQLFAESLGKNRVNSNNEIERFGFTPIVALGSVDQHSQLQLYVDGPRDKFFTVITTGDHPETDPIEVSGFTNPISRSLDKHTMAELMVAHQQVTIQTLLETGCDVRNIHLDVLDEESIGELMMFSILEVLCLALIWDIDPFNQPGVKNGKDRVIALMRG